MLHNITVVTLNYYIPDSVKMQEVFGYYARVVSREVFFVSAAKWKSHKIRVTRRETAFLPFLCIAKRVLFTEPRFSAVL